MYWLNAVQRGWFLRLRNVSREASEGGELELRFRSNSHLNRVTDCALSVVSHIKPNLYAALSERHRIVATAAQNDQLVVLNSQELDDELADDCDVETKRQESTSIKDDDDTGVDICLKHPLHQGTVVMYNRAPLSRVAQVHSDKELLYRCWVRCTGIYPSDVRDIYRSSTKKFEFALCLEDMSGVVEAWVCGEEAERFLGMESCDLRSNNSEAEKIREQVRSLMSPCAWFSCCLFRSYGRFYVFGTSLKKSPQLL